MLKHSLRFTSLAAIVFTAAALSAAQSPPHPQWVGTWAASPMQADGVNIRLFSSVTMREIVHISAGGPQIRLRFTNEFGLDPLTVADAHVALSAGGASIQPGSDHAVSFGGAASVNIPPGGAIFSDPVPLAIAPLSDVAVSFYLPPQIMRAETFHSFADQDNYLADGHSPAAPDLPQPATLSSWYFFDGIDVSAAVGSVAAAPDFSAVVTLGDSITDGAHSTHNANRRWPDVLAARLSQDPNLAHVAVLNEGIGGNRVLNEVTGPSAISRVDRDVLAQSGVRYVIVLESINDIGRLAHVLVPWDAITAPQLEWGLKQIADRAHEHGIKIIGATLTPYGGAAYYCDAGEQVREAVNDWIRSSGVFDGVIDFDKITRDPQNPKAFNSPYDSGDHLHPSDEGYKAMGEGIDLTLFAK
ncbi:MAG: SGNH/GDSL hydrolase family protein [Terracidiphilus sp.]